jgi:hypothetical protein
LHRGVCLQDETVDAPIEWLVSVICEEFHCRPSQAEWEIENNTQMVLDILDMRGYVRAYQTLKAAKSEGDVRVTRAVAKVFEIEREILRRRNQR